MPLSKNKGEWSELYTLFRLLGEGKVHAGDANMNKLELYYPIINIIREETQRNGRLEYKPDSNTQIVVIDENGVEFARIPMREFLEQSQKLLHTITTTKAAAFSAIDAESFMARIGCTSVTASSHDKTDIHIVIHDLRTNMTPELGFSIKSQLGSPATLLNATQPTNIEYKVVGYNLTDDEIASINDIDDHLPRIQAILDKGCSIEYHDIPHETFKNNLIFIDSMMPQFVALCLLYNSLPTATTTIEETVKLVAETNPFHFKGKSVKTFYEHKMKSFLLDTALGMTPATEWDGRYDANGGYLVVRKDGEIVCYHFYNRNDVEDYLYNNTRFERGSRSRHKFGSLYRGTDGDVYIKLNLQIRFKK